MVVLMTWNVRGVISFTTCLSTFLEKEKCDILHFKHKLKESTHNYLVSIHNEYACFVKLDDGNRCTIIRSSPVKGASRSCTRNI